MSGWHDGRPPALGVPPVPDGLRSTHPRRILMRYGSLRERSYSQPAGRGGGAVRPTQRRTLAVMRVCGGGQSFNPVNTLRVLGRWMRMFIIPNPSSVPKAYDELRPDGRMNDNPYRDRLVDVMEEMWKFTLVTRDLREFLVDRYSERREEVATALSADGRRQDRRPEPVATPSDGLGNRSWTEVPGRTTSRCGPLGWCGVAALTSGANVVAGHVVGVFLRRLTSPWPLVHQTPTTRRP